MTTTRHTFRLLSRREFIRVASVAAGSFAASASALGALTGCDASEELCDSAAGEFCLPSLGGAPDTFAGQVIAAFCDTVIPGAYRDPEGKPGAIDVGAAALFFDPLLPAQEFVDLLAAYLDGTSRRDFGDRNFIQLTPEEREQAVEIAVDGFEMTEFAIQLARLAFYASEGAAEYLGYPGANPGYRNHPDFTFGVALAEEITEDGNYP